MTALSYREYVTDLQRRISKLRISEDVSASIEIAICRNAYCYKSEEVTGGNGGRRCSAGPLNSTTGLKEGDGTETQREIDAFFALPVIYAYSDFALSNGRSPLTKSHWDGTVALIEVRYATTITTWHQRMLFIGFADPVHADFTVGLDSDLFVNGHNAGTQLFEWRAAPDRVPASEMAAVDCNVANGPSSPDRSSLRRRLALFTNTRWFYSTPRRTNSL